VCYLSSFFLSFSSLFSNTDQIEIVRKKERGFGVKVALIVATTTTATTTIVIITATIIIIFAFHCNLFYFHANPPISSFSLSLFGWCLKIRKKNNHNNYNNNYNNNNKN
jgi:hypothetical protein